MAHPEQQAFCQRVKERFPDYFKDKHVLDCGSYDVNGNNRFLFDGGAYTGIDVADGPNVDVVSTIHEYRPGEEAVFDTVISTECFEHDRHFASSVERIVKLMKPDGLFLFTCATTGRAEHGTVATTPADSPATVAVGGGWENYYRNIPPEVAIGIGKQYFKQFGVEVDAIHGDLYFWGVGKK